MSNARMICRFVKAHSDAVFPGDRVSMQTHVLEWLEPSLNTVGSGSHKYIPTEELNEKLGLKQGAGVFGYLKMQDGSYVLRTCNNGVAYWDGSAEFKELGLAE